MIQLHNPSATRLAFRLAHTAFDHLSWVYLASDGRLFATDGEAIVISNDAHDADSDVFVKMDKYAKLSTTAQSYEIDTRDDILIEHRARSQQTYDIHLMNDVEYPPVYRVVPTHLSEYPDKIPPFDSIKAGKLASDYGLDRGFWLGGPGDSVHLAGTDPTDFVILARADIQKVLQNQWNHRS